MLKLETRCNKAVVKLAKRMRDIREKKGVSKRELSQRSGVSRAAIRRIEEGERSPSLYILLLLAGSMDVNLGEVLSEIENSYKA